jgi:hypothetical protein
MMVLAALFAQSMYNGFFGITAGLLSLSKRLFVFDRPAGKTISHDLNTVSACR